MFALFKDSATLSVGIRFVYRVASISVDLKHTGWPVLVYKISVYKVACFSRSDLTRSSPAALPLCVTSKAFIASTLVTGRMSNYSGLLLLFYVTNLIISAAVHMSVASSEAPLLSQLFYLYWL